MLELFVEAGPQSGQRFALATATVLGRGQFADLVIADLAVSRRHAQIEPDGSAWLLRDLESANGTRHNGKALRAPVRLGDGDTVELGQTRLRVRRANAAGGSPLPLPALRPDELPEQTLLAPDARPPDRQAIMEGSPPLPAAGSERRRQVVLRLQFFQHMAELLVRAGRTEQQLRDALAALAEAVPGCRRLALLMRDSPVAAWRVRAQRVSAADELNLDAAQAIAAATQATGRAFVAGGASTPAAVGAVVSHAGEDLGVLYLDAKDDSEALSAADTEFLVSCAAQFGTLLAGMRAPAVATPNADDETAQARQIQDRFLPVATPRLDGYEIADSYRAARAVSGDLFDFLVLGDGRPLVFICDVSVHGYPGALLMARVGAHLRAIAPRAQHPAALLKMLDATLRADLSSGHFVTAAAAALDPARGTVDLACAGHPTPLLRRAESGVETLSVAASPALGVGGARFHETRVELARGDGLLFYTDGLDEARDVAGVAFGLQRVKDLLGGARSAGQAIELIDGAVQAHRGRCAAFDDITMVALWRR